MASANKNICCQHTIGSNDVQFQHCIINNFKIEYILTSETNEVILSYWYAKQTFSTFPSCTEIEFVHGILRNNCVYYFDESMPLAFCG